LRLFYRDHQVADLELQFLHNGRPAVVRKATMQAEGANLRYSPSVRGLMAPAPPYDFNQTLLKILASLNVCSKEWIIRQYDHEVQGGSVVKPLVGVRADGPGDAAVVMPVLGSWTGLAIGCGINPHYGDLDPYWMAAAAVDEAVRNVVAVGADPARIALLDNFCWGNTDRPEVLGSLVRAAEACRDISLAYTMPFISGKDSLNNEYHSGDSHISIPATLLISAMGRVPDVRRCVTMDLKEPGNRLFLIGTTRNEMGGSHYHLVNHISGGSPPTVNFESAPGIFRKLHEAIQRGLIRSCHDISEGGLAAAVAEMAFAGGIGADLTGIPSMAQPETDAVLLFSESPTRFVVEVSPANIDALHDCLGSAVPHFSIGQTCREERLRIVGRNGEWAVWVALKDLQEAWQKPLQW
jgi:phosphoribosylformylglycinamidine synthase